MKVIIVKNRKRMSKKAADIILNEAIANPGLTIGFATGSTPIGLYRRLIRSKVNLSGITTFNLDEYYPTKKTN